MKRKTSRQNFYATFLLSLILFLTTQDYITVWLAGHPELARNLDRPNNAALASRIQARYTIQPINDRDEFKQLLHVWFY